MIASTPAPPYYAVIFTSVRSGEDKDYKNIADQMVMLAQQQEGFLGMESARNETGITVSYWKDLESIKRWKLQADHRMAQQMGREHYYTQYKTRICLVERDYMFEKK